MINIKSVQKLINESKKKVAPRVFFAFNKGDEEKAEAEATDKDIIFTFNREKAKIKYLTKEGQEESWKGR